MKYCFRPVYHTCELSEIISRVPEYLENSNHYAAPLQNILLLCLLNKWCYQNDCKVLPLASLCHSGLSGIFLVFSEGFPTRFTRGNDIPFELFITPVVCETLHYRHAFNSLFSISSTRQSYPQFMNILLPPRLLDGGDITDKLIIMNNVEEVQYGKSICAH